ncbi:Caveolin-2 [Galemys pyrenaicus]|uniref:Caveolin n=1 Tax=Galemys pyrenaicus TaxID=202257 RepID=A0A8J6A9I5_GALPY|nr:Caveolin-2 [Galemys pyrenaicus]
MRPGTGAGSGKRPPPGPCGARRTEAGRGRASREPRRAAPRQPCCSRRSPSAAMGLETEKADVQLFMDDDSYSRHSGVDYADPEKFVDLGPDRDPHRLNSHLKVGFEDVIAEPVTTHSFDKVWICSHALFEISKYVMYKFLTVFLAIPLAFAAGILFATLSCLHICDISKATSNEEHKDKESKFQDCNAFCKDLPNDPTFSTDNMEECDRCCHCPIVYKRRTQLLFCQPATEPRLNTWTPGLKSSIL